MKNYHPWNASITRLLKIDLKNQGKPYEIELSVAARAGELTKKEAGYLLDWFLKIPSSANVYIKYKSTLSASVALKLYDFGNDVKVNCIEKMFQFHDSRNMSFYSLNAFRNGIQKIPFTVSDQETFDTIFKRFINISDSHLNIYARATAIEGITKMASLDKLTHAQLLNASRVFAINHGVTNPFLKEYAREGLNIVVHKARGTEIQDQLEDILKRNLIDSRAFSAYVSAIKNISVYTQEFIKRSTEDIFKKMHEGYFTADTPTTMLTIHDTVYMATSEEDAIFTFDVLKKELTGSSDTAVLAASQAIAKMTAMLPEDLLIEGLSLILDATSGYAARVMEFRNNIGKIIDRINEPSYIRNAIEICANATNNNYNPHKKVSGLYCIQEILTIHEMSKEIIQYIISTEFYKNRGIFIENKIYNGETFLLLIKKALDLGMEDYLEEVFNWAPKSHSVEDPIEVLNLINWEESVRSHIDVEYYKNRTLYECIAEDCYSTYADDDSFADADLI